MKDSLTPADQQIQQIKSRIEEFHLALDMRENGSTVAWRALQHIQGILGMPWVQGEAQRKQANRKDVARPEKNANA